MQEIKNGGISPAHSKCCGVAALAGTMQFGTTIANAIKIRTTLASVLATTKRFGEGFGMVA
jgi:hypothetical protein